MWRRRGGEGPGGGGESIGFEEVGICVAVYVCIYSA